MHARTNEQTDAKWMGVEIAEWMDEWTDESVDEWVNK